MISDYLNSLYKNCPSLSKTEAFDHSASEKYFSDRINLIVKGQNLANEEELVRLLISGSNAQLREMLDNNTLLKIFYLVNSLCEFDRPPNQYDELGRFKYENSVQVQTGITRNLVWELMKSSVSEERFLNVSFKVSDQRSFFFLSHDIDSLFGSMLQDGLWALKHKRFDVMLKLFLNILTAKPHWFNIDLIMKLESEFDFKSTFFWLVNKGKIDRRQTNSDYTIHSKKLVGQINKVEALGFENGIHKSISNESLKDETSKLKTTVVGNRYHYLKYQLPHAYEEISASGLKLDASLGFAEHYGFRNNYGYPFSPYNFKSKTHYSFIEVPLNIMDGTFQRYLKIPVDETASSIIDFLEKNKENSLISVLWHNTFFTDYKYKGYKEEYIKLLKYFYEQKFNNINQTGIIDLFSWKK